LDSRKPQIFANSDATAPETTFHTGCDTMNGTKGTNGSPTGPKLLWEHPSPKTTPMYQFLKLVNETHNLRLSNYSELHAWSVNNVNSFWQRAWDFVGIRHQGTPTSVSRLGFMHIIFAYNG
jgi:hypothetical protein